ATFLRGAYLSRMPRTYKDRPRLNAADRDKRETREPFTLQIATNAKQEDPSRCRSRQTRNKSTLHAADRERRETRTPFMLQIIHGGNHTHPSSRSSSKTP